MTEPVTKPAPPVQTPPPAPVVAAKDRDKEAMEKAGQKKGFSPLRPFIYAKEFVVGTITDGLNLCAQWGNKAAKIGFWGGLAVGIFGGGAALGLAGVVSYMVLGGIAGLAGGATLGAVAGLATGGMRAVNRQQRAEKYADELIVREKTKRLDAGSTGVDYRTAYKNHQQRVTRMIDRIQQQEREIEQDIKDANRGTHWQDRVSASRDHGNSGWGQGF